MSLPQLLEAIRFINRQYEIRHRLFAASNPQLADMADKKRNAWRHNLEMLLEIKVTGN